MGLKVFGTIALGNALADVESLTEDDWRKLRDTLFYSRAYGLDLTPEELITFGRREGFLLTNTLTTAFNDRSGWRERPRGLWGSVLPFLEAVFEHDPALFDVWVARALDAAWFAQEATPRDVHAANMILIALDPISARPIISDACFQALVRVLKRGLPIYLRYGRVKEPEEIALESLSNWSGSQTPAQRVALLLRVDQRFGTDYDRLVAKHLGPGSPG